MEEDLEGSWRKYWLMSNEELEIYYNNEFYVGFHGYEFKIKEQDNASK